MTWKPTFAHDDAHSSTWYTCQAPATDPASAAKGNFNYPCARAHA
jgi:hypothetical protein